MAQNTKYFFLPRGIFGARFRVEIQVCKMGNFTTPIVPQPQNRDIGDA
jgi:hypothetical protein